jgi:hypothetical protein
MASQLGQQASRPDPTVRKLQLMIRKFEAQCDRYQQFASTPRSEVDQRQFAKCAGQIKRLAKEIYATVKPFEDTKNNSVRASQVIQAMKGLKPMPGFLYSLLTGDKSFSPQARPLITPVFSKDTIREFIDKHKPLDGVDVIDRQIDSPLKYPLP